MFKVKKEGTTIDGVRIYMANIDSYIAESYFLLKSHANFVEKNFDKMNSFKDHKRREYFELLSTALEQNLKNIDNIVRLLKENVTLDAYEKIDFDRKHQAEGFALRDYLYLRRDWSFAEENERQIWDMKQSISKELNEIEFNNQKSLFLGCGVGRLAIEFIDSFEKVLAVDRSFSMIWHLEQLLRGNSITFYNIKTYNIQKIQNATKKYNVSIPEDINNKITSENFRCFVCDVLDLPLEEKTIDVIFSIYFSDVMPLRLWFNGVNNVLKENGLFVHFGPLHYFFSDEREMLTAEEFKAFFEKNGYTSLVDKSVETSHLWDSDSNTQILHRNWLFIARKGIIQKDDHSITLESVLRVSEPLTYERKGTIHNYGFQDNEVNLILPHATFDGADDVIWILSLIDGKRPFSKIIESLRKKKIKIDQSDIDEVKLLLKTFLEQGILEKIS